ncbi:MAG: hypothetical protein PHN80_07845 [Hespellia sp.]|nr:hypothetical protein [Hespellia sp.]
MSCPTTVHNNVCIDAEITIKPVVTVGEIRTYCIKEAAIGRCSGTISPDCSFHVRQEICVQVPLTFEADASATPIGIVCGTPDTGICNESDTCTRTIGYYKTHESTLAALLLEAGGSIVLGNSAAGLGYTVTTVAEAIHVLEFSIPDSALPTTSVYATQYRVLYAQLLGAKLNVLAGADCSYANTAISQADHFLAASPSEGTSGAPDYQSALAVFNEGNAEGCPEHCE